MENANVIVTTMEVIVQVSFHLIGYGILNEMFLFFDQSIAAALQHAKEMATVHHLEHVNVIVITTCQIVQVSFHSSLFNRKYKNVMLIFYY